MQELDPGSEAKVSKSATAAFSDDAENLIELDHEMCQVYLTSSTGIDKLAELFSFDGTESVQFHGIKFGDDFATELEERFVLVEET